MRKIAVLAFITLDGVMQSPGAPKEDTEGEFIYGGWVAPYGDEVADKAMQKLLSPADLMLGRKTFDIWENYWPSHADSWPGINEVTKYIISGKRINSDWSNCVFLRSVANIKRLKKTKGADIKVWGSSKLVHLLLKHDLIDELHLIIHPIILGKGKKLFASHAAPAAFTLTESVVTTTGVIIASYKRAGEVKTGTVGT